MRITLELTGTTPLLCHSIQLADPDNPVVREIQAITGKRKKTEDDRRAIEKYEWYGGLYLDSEIDGPAMPTANIRRCLVQAGKISKQGLQVQRALAFGKLHVPLAYEGPRDVDQLFKLPQFHNRAAVGISGKRTMRVRPCFPAWTVIATAELLDDVMDLTDLQRVAERAGLAEGLGDNRANGYGRFEAKVV